MNLFFVIVMVASSTTWASSFECSRWTPAQRRVEKPKSCDDTGGYGLLTQEIMNRSELNKLFSNKSEKQVSDDEHLKNIALEAKFRITSNMNGARFTFPSGVERIVFRGSYQAPMFSEKSVLERHALEKDSKRACMKRLVKKYSLSKILNYDELDWNSAIQLTSDEQKLFSEINPRGAYWEFTPSQNGRTFQYKFKKTSKKQVMDDVAFIIREIEGSKNDQGSAYIHCYGGHHRTGAVWGVLQKCIGKMDVEAVLAEYKCHIGYQSKEQPGGYHVDNETLIREFPCSEYFGN